MPHFAKRHYEAIALVLQEAKQRCDGPHELTGVYKVEDILLELFKEDNKAFDAARFETACFPGTNVRARKVA